MTTTHEPPNYACPFCATVAGVVDEHTGPLDLVERGDLAYARIAPKWWPENPGSVLIIPTHHIENIYDCPDHVGHAVWDLTRRVAAAMRSAYGCDGVSVRQHNEPAGDQDVWHLHVHVLPRYVDDRLYLRHLESRWVDADEREPYAELLRDALR